VRGLRLGGGLYAVHRAARAAYRRPVPALPPLRRRACGAAALPDLRQRRPAPGRPRHAANRGIDRAPLSGRPRGANRPRCRAQSARH
jgi:hypothetical protein